MKIPVKLIFLLLLFLPVLSYAANTAQQILNDAIVINKKADALQGAWISTQNLIKKAKVAITSKNNNEALKIAKKAKSEAQLSLQQAQEQLKNWAEPPYVK